MNNEEAKQWIRNQIDSSIKTQDDCREQEYVMYHNKQYLRALKLSKITGQPVNKDDFKGGVPLFWVNDKLKLIYPYSRNHNYLEEHYSKVYVDQKKIVEEVFNEYSEYKGHEIW